MKNPKLELSLLLLALLFAYSSPAAAHCDTLDGPVVTDARQALANSDVTQTLKWVAQKDEPQIRDAFQKTIAVRKLGPEAQELADMYFYETLVRVHRAGENAPYTGLKPAGAVEPAVQAADEALETGSPDHLVKLATENTEKGLRQRFEHASETRQKAAESVEAGREYVRAYVEFVHYAERIYNAAAGPAAHEAAGAAAAGAAAEGHAH